MYTNSNILGPGTALIKAYREQEHGNNKASYRLFMRACNHPGSERLMEKVSRDLLQIKAHQDTAYESDYDDGDEDDGGFEDESMESSYYGSRTHTPTLMRMSSAQIYNRCCSVIGKQKMDRIIYKAANPRMRSQMVASGKFKDFFKALPGQFSPSKIIKEIRTAWDNWSDYFIKEIKKHPSGYDIKLWEKRLATPWERFKRGFGAVKAPLILAVLVGLGIVAVKRGKVWWDARKLKKHTGIDAQKSLDKAAKDKGINPKNGEPITSSYFDDDYSSMTSSSSSIQNLLLSAGYGY
jgi:hypothetical protein